jgi:cytochrome b subunit of formate dehydrogenase
VSEFFNLHTFVAFVLGVLLSAMVKGWVSTARAKI